jgi:5-methylcytosine-specific restriction endonuclease McrA
MTSIPDELRQQIITRANERCEYCQSPLIIVVEMEIDHIIPESAGGSTTLDNLCLACVGCNGFKLAFQEAEDPETGRMMPLYNPRTQRWDDHFAWGSDSAFVVG